MVGWCREIGMMRAQRRRGKVAGVMRIAAAAPILWTRRDGGDEPRMAGEEA